LSIPFGELHSCLKSFSVKFYLFQLHISVVVVRLYNQYFLFCWHKKHRFSFVFYVFFYYRLPHFPWFLKPRQLYIRVFHLIMYNKVVVSQDSTTRINTFVLKPCIALITFLLSSPTRLWLLATPNIHVSPKPFNSVYFGD